LYNKINEKISERCEDKVTAENLCFGVVQLVFVRYEGLIGVYPGREHWGVSTECFHLAVQNI